MNKITINYLFDGSIGEGVISEFPLTVIEFLNKGLPFFNFSTEFKLVVTPDVFCGFHVNNVSITLEAAEDQVVVARGFYKFLSKMPPIKDVTLIDVRNTETGVIVDQLSEMGL